MQHANESAGVEALCDLLLQVAGRDATRLISVRRHAHVLKNAIPFMSEAQAAVAKERISRLETKWGSLLPDMPNCGKIAGLEPESIVRQWLSKRRNSERLLHVVYRAASSIRAGETRLLDVMEYAYAEQTDRILRVVGYDSFKEWMVQLRIGNFDHSGRVKPGPLCEWWIENLGPETRNSSTYAACLRRTQ